MTKEVQCRVCGAPVPSGTGVGVRLRTRTYAVCEDHAPAVRELVKGASTVVTGTARHVMQTRTPGAFALGQRLWGLYAQVRPREETP